MVKKQRGRPKCFKRHEVLSKALEVFWEHGYQATSMSMLSKAMGLTPPSIYAEFGDKQQLFIAVLESYHSSYTQQLLSIFNDPAINLVAALEAFFQISREALESENCRGCLVVNSSLVVGQDTAISEKIKSFYLQIEALLAARLERARQDEELKASQQPTVLARHAYGITIGAAALARAHREGKVGQQFIDTASAGFLSRL